MRNFLLLIAGVIVLLILGVVSYTVINKKDTQNPLVTVFPTSTPIETNTPSVQESTLSYLPYSKDTFDSAAVERRVLFFYADWCPTCRPADKNFSENINQIPDDVTLIRVNYNDQDTEQEEKDLAKKYNVTYQHTFVQIDQNGNEVTKWNGGQIEELLSKIK
jgi:thioredoxin 1